MTDILLSVTLQLVLFAAACSVLSIAGREIRIRPILAGIGIFLLYVAMSILGSKLQAGLPLTASLHENWGGKVCAIVAGCAVLRLSPSIDKADIGLKWRQRPGALVPALAMIMIVCALDWVHEVFYPSGQVFSAPRLWFEGVMPGLDEELYYRGLMLALFVRAFGRSGTTLNARFGTAEILLTCLFAAGHGLRFVHGHLTTDIDALMLTGTIGAGLMWIRTRTNSLVLPAIAHNLINFGETLMS